MNVVEAMNESLARLAADGRDARPGWDALAELALTLARVLEGAPPQHVARICRELRATLLELEVLKAASPGMGVTSPFGDLIESWSRPVLVPARDDDVG